ncbi:hypothetical protein [Brevibacterium sp.]|uniref:hypothetical protein n=1 Tax=Brevibacterium sp. TaxID=1701 RepID=UPI0025C17956|nr:hypothetical protein [Brevibacterium sp.]
MQEPQILVFFVIVAAFAVCFALGGWLIVRAVRNPEARIGAATRRRYEEMQDQRLLEEERRRYRAEQSGEDPAGEQRLGEDDSPA